MSASCPFASSGESQFLSHEIPISNPEAFGTVGALVPQDAQGVREVFARFPGGFREFFRRFLGGFRKVFAKVFASKIFS